VTLNGVSGEYHHPFVQTCAMFLGQSLCLIVFFAKKSYNGKDDKEYESILDEDDPKGGGLKTSINPLLLCIPACCDICASSIMFVALT